jgi:hypothetical protein
MHCMKKIYSTDILHLNPSHILIPLSDVHQAAYLSSEQSKSSISVETWQMVAPKFQVKVLAMFLQWC